MIRRKKKAISRVLIIPEEKFLIASLPMAFSLHQQREDLSIYYLTTSANDHLFRKLSWVEKAVLYTMDKSGILINETDSLVRFLRFDLVIVLDPSLRSFARSLAPGKIMVFSPKRKNIFPSLKSHVHSALYYRYLDIIKKAGFRKKYHLPAVMGLEYPRKPDSLERGFSAVEKREPEKKKPEIRKILWILDCSFPEELFFSLMNLARNHTHFLGFYGSPECAAPLFLRLARQKIKFRSLGALHSRDDQLAMEHMMDKDMVVSTENGILHLAGLVQKVHFGFLADAGKLHVERTLPLESHSLYYGDYLVPFPQVEQYDAVLKKFSVVIRYLNGIP